MGTDAMMGEAGKHEPKSYSLRTPRPHLIEERTGYYRAHALGPITGTVNWMARIGRFLITSGGLRHPNKPSSTE